MEGNYFTWLEDQTALTHTDQYHTCLNSLQFVCACVRACVHACMHAWMDGWMDGWMDVCVCVCVCEHVCMCVCACVCVCEHMCVCVHMLFYVVINLFLAIIIIRLNTLFFFFSF